MNRILVYPAEAPIADSHSANLNLTLPEVGAAEDTWGGPAGLNGSLAAIDAVFAPNGDGVVFGGNGVGLKVGTGKTLNATGGTVLVTDARFEIRNNTRHARLSAINCPSGVTTDYLLPPVGDTLVGIAQAQVLTNKTTPDPPVGDNTQKLVPAHWVNAAITAAVNAAIAAYSPFSTGDIMASSAVKPGWLQLNGLTVGNAGSGATGRANADCLNLFSHFWSINTNAWTINGGRGASAAADFAALKTITLPDARGYALVHVGGDVGLGVYFAKYGAATVALAEANVPAHTHTVPLSWQLGGVGSGGGSGFNMFTQSGTTTTSGGSGTGTAHNNVQPSMGTVFWIKL